MELLKKLQAGQICKNMTVWSFVFRHMATVIVMEITLLNSVTVIFYILMTSYHTSAVPAVHIYSESQKYLYFLVAGNIIVLISHYYINLLIAFFSNRGPNLDHALTTNNITNATG